MSIKPKGGFGYFPDDLSRYGYVYLVKHKSDPLKILKIFIMKSKINLARQLKQFDLIVVVNIWAKSFMITWRVVEFFHN